MNLKQFLAMVLTIITVKYLTGEVFGMSDYWVGYVTATSAMVVARILED